MLLLKSKVFFSASLPISETNSEPIQTSEMELFEKKIGNS